MSEKDNGGPAFPVAVDQKHWDYPGMTLRDWFAGQALACVMQRFEPGSDPDTSDIAIQAYMIADAMLAERDQ